MPDEAQSPAPPTPLAGLVITLIGVVGFAGWIALGLTRRCFVAFAQPLSGAKFFRT